MKTLGHLHIKIKNSSAGLLAFLFRLFSGGVLALTIALAGEEIFAYGSFSFSFVWVSVLLSFLRVSRSWNFFGIFIFDLICVLVGMLLRMYILIAPGA
ncbi:MAG: hypothetical protein D6797_07515 [Bdellovibrio sp.]|nr:MAG: hypothetical protein D6797_07515 [Bdellovibrio sp.]